MIFRCIIVNSNKFLKKINFYYHKFLNKKNVNYYNYINFVTTSITYVKRTMIIREINLFNLQTFNIIN